MSAEDNNSFKKYPVKRYLRNTFDNLLNDAIFALKKKQHKNPQDTDLFTKEGSCRFVALYLLDINNLPKQETEPDFYDPNEDEEY